MRYATAAGLPARASAIARFERALASCLKPYTHASDAARAGAANAGYATPNVPPTFASVFGFDVRTSAETPPDTRSVPPWLAACGIGRPSVVPRYFTKSGKRICLPAGTLTVAETGAPAASCDEGVYVSVALTAAADG